MPHFERQIESRAVYTNLDTPAVISQRLHNLLALWQTLQDIIIHHAPLPVQVTLFKQLDQRVLVPYPEWWFEVVPLVFGNLYFRIVTWKNSKSM